MHRASIRRAMAADCVRAMTSWRRTQPLGIPLLLMLVALVVALVVAPPVAGQQPEYLGIVTRVVDGDTIYVAIGNQIEAVRYIGINTPETHHPTRGRERGGEAAREINRQLVDGRQVRLVLDVQHRDRYGRLLAYVYVGDRFVNAELVHHGHAAAATYPPNVRYADYFRSLERGARERSVGLWSLSAPAVVGPKVEDRHDDRGVRQEPNGAVSIPIPGQVDDAMRRADRERGSGAAPSPGSSGGPVHIDSYQRRDGTTVREYQRRR